MREPTRDPLGLRAEAPLFDAFLRFAAATLHPFTIPGHKHRRDLLGPLVDSTRVKPTPKPGSAQPGPRKPSAKQPSAANRSEGGR